MMCKSELTPRKGNDSVPPRHNSTCRIEPSLQEACWPMEPVPHRVPRDQSNLIGVFLSPWRFLQPGTHNLFLMAPKAATYQCRIEISSNYRSDAASAAALIASSGFRVGAQILISWLNVKRGELF